VTLRAAREKDVDAVVAIDEAAFAYDRLTRRKVRRLLEHGNCALFVAEIRGAVVGYALVLFRRGASAARLYGIAVAASHRGRGIGRRLVVAAEKEASRRGLASITLEADPRRRPALSLYRSMGYRRIARLGPYYEDGSAADRYVKTLRATSR